MYTTLCYPTLVLGIQRMYQNFYGIVFGLYAV
jgi:hypothetical protein